MKSLFDEADVHALSQRLAGLSATTAPRWGSFTADRMICHLVDQLDFAFSGPRDAEVLKGPPMLVRHAIRVFLPWPRGTPTAREMLRTQPDRWESDLATLKQLMNRFLQSRDRADWAVHPFFGVLSGAQWARLAWRHNDHHLRQFGV